MTCCVTARMSLFLLVLSAASVVLFVMVIAGSVWPAMAIALSALTGLVFTLGYLGAAWRLIER